MYEAALDSFTRARQAVEDHVAANKPIFDAHQRLVGNVIDTENALRDAAAEAGKGLSNGTFNVTVTPQTQVFADIETIDQLIKEGKIDPSLREKIVKTVTRPPRITIGKSPTV